MELERENISDFEFEPWTGTREEIRRPSLSYWQDAWLRLKKNQKSFYSLFLVLFILGFSILGPFIWRVDPAHQNLFMISRGPSLGDEAVVVVDSGDVELRRVEPGEPGEIQLAPQNLKVEGLATTRGVLLSWDPVPGAQMYQIFRSESRPESRDALGIPLGQTAEPGVVGFVDQLKLESETYYYSVVPSDGVDDSQFYSMVAVKPLMAIQLSDAEKLGPVRPGDKIKLPAAPFGTDYLGRDILARLMLGGRISFFIGIIGPLLYILFGIFYGGVAGYLGGRWDNLLMRFADLVIALPFLLFMILFRVVFGAQAGDSGIVAMLVALALLSWPAAARLVRGQVLQIREMAFTQAAKMMGAKPIYIIFRHMVPNTIGVILVTLTFAIPSAIFTEAFLSFIGMGVVPPTPSWGSMSNEGIRSLFTTPHELIFPSLFIGVSVLAFNLLGDGLRDALDPRLRSTE